MSAQRVAKVESVIQHATAQSIRDVLEGDAARVTVTRVDCAPDMRSAIVWIGLLGTDSQIEVLWERLVGARHRLQHDLAGKMTTKFVPQLHLRQDTGGAYAAEIDRLLRAQPDL
jgi:ribosome-binding factor A